MRVNSLQKGHAGCAEAAGYGVHERAAVEFMNAECLPGWAEPSPLSALLSLRPIPSDGFPGHPETHPSP